VSKEEQAVRLRARLDAPHKRWKLRRDDLDARAQWDDYQRAFQEAVEETSTEHAPWYVIPADKKWYRNWAVATIVTAQLEAMDLAWPPLAEELSGVVIE
jgi:polyphosphate kinase 2 (PPK2 family)